MEILAFKVMELIFNVQILLCNIYLFLFIEENLKVWLYLWIYITQRKACYNLFFKMRNFIKDFFTFSSSAKPAKRKGEANSVSFSGNP